MQEKQLSISSSNLLYSYNFTRAQQMTSNQTQKVGVALFFLLRPHA
jgi:hypothetical protein